MLAVLELADLFVLILTPHLGNLRSAQHFLSVAKRLGLADDRMCFVLNRSTSMAGLSFDDVATAVGSRAIHQLPTAAPELTLAINEGRPPVLQQPRWPFSRGLQALFEQVRNRIAEPVRR